MKDKMTKLNFASDNYAGIHPEVLASITSANQVSAVAYGDDEYTQQAIKKIQDLFGQSVQPFFVFNGTAANVISLAAMTESFNAIVCVESAHIQVDECGAPEKFTGCKLLTAPSENGKLTIPSIEKYFYRMDDQHYAQPKVISISQSTEYGTVYSIAEIKEIAEFAHARNLYLHVDGARIANAVVSSDASFAEMITDTNVDVLSFGGTKNGLMCGEAIVFLNPELAKNCKYIRKQSMQLASKMRFISAQFTALLNKDLWQRNATQANKMASLLEEHLKKIPQIIITQPVQANAIFAIMRRDIILRLQDKFSFYIWNEARDEVRIMTSFNTTEDEVLQFANAIETEFN